MKNKNAYTLMTILVLAGCLATYQFINFHNSKLMDKKSPNHLSYDEVHVPTLNKINALIAEQQSKNSAEASFVKKIEKEMLDLKVTKEIYLHNSNEAREGTPAFPIVLLWAAISAFAFVLLIRKERREKSLNNSYEKILDQLEMSYSQDISKEKTHGETKEPSKDFRPKVSKEI